MRALFSRATGRLGAGADSRGVAGAHRVGAVVFEVDREVHRDR